MPQAKHPKKYTTTTKRDSTGGIFYLTTQRHDLGKKAYKRLKAELRSGANTPFNHGVTQ